MSKGEVWSLLFVGMLIGWVAAPSPLWSVFLGGVLLGGKRLSAAQKILDDTQSYDPDGPR